MLRHCGTTEIKTNRLILKPYSKNYVEGMFYGWMSDERVAKCTSWYKHTNINATHAYVDYIMGQDKNKSYNWVIEFNEKIIGTINVCYLDESLEILGIAYALSHDYWGKGITSDAVKAVAHYLFDKVNCRKIIAGCDSENIGSRKVLEKVGMKQEACLRLQIKRKDGSFGDDLQFGLFKDEFIY